MAQTSRNKPGVEEFGGNAAKASSGDVAMYKMQDSFEKNKKKIIGAVVAVLLIVGAFFGYKYFIQQPNEEKGLRAIVKVQDWFAQDSFNLVINGDGQSMGGLSVINKYSGTNAANLANYYVGVSYLKTGDAANAIKYLEAYNGKGTIASEMVAGLLGDAYMDAGNVDKGIAQYKKATANEKNPTIAALYAFRAGLASERAGKLDDAKQYYRMIKEKFPFTKEAYEVDRFLARLGELNID